MKTFAPIRGGGCEVKHGLDIHALKRLMWKNDQIGLEVHLDSVSNTMFGWVDFREDGKHREEKWVENSVFHCLAKGEKYRGWKTREKIFSPGPQISSSQIGRKTMERKVLSRPNYRNALSFPMVTATQQRRRRQFSNPRLGTIHHHHRNPKITQNQHKKQLKINSNPIRKPIPNPTQNQPKTKSTQNQPIFIFIIIIIFSLPCSFRTIKKKREM